MRNLRKLTVAYGTVLELTMVYGTFEKLTKIPLAIAANTSITPVRCAWDGCLQGLVHTYNDKNECAEQRICQKNHARRICNRMTTSVCPLGILGTI